MHKSDVVVCSFYTDDEYYRAHAKRLGEQLAEAGVFSEIKEVEKRAGEDWADICRRKVPFIAEVCRKHPDKKVFWIDVDCQLLKFPDQVREFSADIIGFQRGFETPLRIGYQNGTRFWEPCFWGINTTPGGRKFVSDAADLERNRMERATDDYFFEESWRANCTRLTFQILPSIRVKRDGIEGEDAFFSFGVSGKVAEFQYKVTQHTRPEFTSTKHLGQMSARLFVSAAKATVPRSLMPIARKVADRSGLTNLILRNETALYGATAREIREAIDSGDLAILQSCVSKFRAYALNEEEEALLNSAKAMMGYLTGPDLRPLPLAWWSTPAPGNFGDWLSPYIFKRLLNRPIRYIDPIKATNEDHVFSVGSIGRFVKRTSFVLGTGISRATAELEPQAKYAMLRGPLTGRALIRCGGKDPGVYGDPALALSQIYSPASARSNGRIAVVRHYVHRKIGIKLPDEADELSVLMSSAAEIENFISTLTSYDAVITSAMHVFIVCQSYGVKAALVTFEGAEDAVHGDSIKYEDFFRGAGLPPQAPISVSRDLRKVKLDDIIYPERVSVEKMMEVRSRLESGVREFLDQRDVGR